MTEWYWRTVRAVEVYIANIYIYAYMYSRVGVPVKCFKELLHQYNENMKFSMKNI